MVSGEKLTDVIDTFRKLKEVKTWRLWKEGHDATALRVFLCYQFGVTNFEKES